MKENYTHETFAPGFDPHGNHTKIEREEDLPVEGVNLVGSKTTDLFGSSEVSLKPMLTSPAPARMMMMASSIHAEAAEDETYALPADKGVVVQVIPDDHLPVDTEGNKPDLLVTPHTSTLYRDARETVIVTYAKPKSPAHHQRHGYSRRKAKRAYQPRYKYMLKVSKFWDPLMTHLQTFDIPTRSDVHMEQFMGRIRDKLEVGSFTRPTKPTPHGKGDLNG